MSIEITDAPREGRWGTINTKLAAALMVYGYKRCTEQPFSTIASSRDPGKTSTSINFVPEHPVPGITDSTAQDWAVAWNSWADFRARTGRYVHPPDWRGPLMIMRRALDARQWFATDGIHKFRAANDPLPDRTFKTEDHLLVVCLISLGLHVFKTEGPRFIFDALRVGTMHREYLEDGARHAIQWSKRACVQQEALVFDIRRPENVANLHLKVGSKVGFAPTNMSSSMREAFVRQLHT